MVSNKQGKAAVLLDSCLSHLLCLDALLGGLQLLLGVELVHQVVGLEAGNLLLQLQAVGLYLLDAFPQCPLSVLRLLLQVSQLPQPASNWFLMCSQPSRSSGVKHVPIYTDCFCLCMCVCVCVFPFLIFFFYSVYISTFNYYV